MDRTAPGAALRPGHWDDCLIASAIHYGVTGIAIALILVLLAIVAIDAIDVILASRARPREPRTPSIPADADPLRAVRTLAARAGGGVWLGAGEDGQWRFARPERAGAAARAVAVG